MDGINEITKIVESASDSQKQLLSSFVNNLATVFNNAGKDEHLAENLSNALDVNEDEVCEPFRPNSMLYHHSYSVMSQVPPAPEYERNPFLDHSEFKGVVNGQGIASAQGKTDESCAEKRPVSVPHSRGSMIKPLGGTEPLQLKQPMGLPPSRSGLPVDKPKTPVAPEKDRHEELRKFLSSRDHATRSVLEDKYRPSTRSKEILEAIHDFTAERLKSRAESRSGPEKFEDTLRKTEDKKPEHAVEFESKKEKLVEELLKKMDNQELDKLKQIIDSGGLKPYTKSKSFQRVINPDDQIHQECTFHDVNRRPPSDYVVHPELASEFKEATRKNRVPIENLSRISLAQELIP